VARLAHLHHGALVLAAVAHLQNLKENTYRDINVYNPLNVSHPPTEEYLDAESRSPVGDGNPNSINLIIPQDCGAST